MVSRVDIIRDTTEATMKIFDEIPSSPSTDARLKLERLGGTSIESKEKLQVLLKALRNESALREKIGVDRRTTCNSRLYTRRRNYEILPLYFRR